VPETKDSGEKAREMMLKSNQKHKGGKGGKQPAANPQQNELFWKLNQ
jgi:hypothetical protein